ncbi:MAG TPA: fatty acid desaturase, partial [Paracoccaceae bacterium]|nr:fatty acid desaturase [Paracoccaceae bacterium]
MEWFTIALAAATYAAWAGVTYVDAGPGFSVTIPLLAFVLAQHSSLQHEILHGHPFRPQWLADLLAYPAVGIFVPYERFRDLHLAHHF